MILVPDLVVSCLGGRSGVPSTPLTCGFPLSVAHQLPTRRRLPLGRQDVASVRKRHGSSSAGRRARAPEPVCACPAPVNRPRFRVELPPPLGHRIPGFLALRTRPHRTSFGVVLCQRVWSCREQDVSRRLRRRVHVSHDAKIEARWRARGSLHGRTPRRLVGGGIAQPRSPADR